MSQLDLVDLNVILHRADGEEQDATGKASTTYLSVFSVLTLFIKVVMVLTLSPTTAPLLSAVLKAGCTPCERSLRRTISVILSVNTCEKVLGHLTML